MVKKTIAFLLLCSAVSFAQSTDKGQSNAADQQPSQKNKGEITATGCVSRSNSNFILMDAGRGNSYQLQGTKNLKLGTYLGQEVEVTGVESPSLSTSSPRSHSASSVTITIRLIKSVQKRCSAN
jgi:hypothetical protein